MALLPIHCTRYIICNYADDTTPYSCAKDIASLATLMTLLPIPVHRIYHL